MNYNKFFSKPINVWIIAGLCCLLWGSAFPGIKTGYELFKIDSNDTFTIILFAGLRFFIAGFLTFVIFSLIYKKPLFPTKLSVTSIGILSLFQTLLQYLFFYLGLAYTTGGNASVIQGTNVFFALVISSLIFKLEKLSGKKIVGCIIGFVGVMVVSVNNISSVSFNDFVGEMLILLSTISYSFSSVFMKKFSIKHNPTMLSSWQFMLGGFLMSVIGLIGGGKLTHITFDGVTLLLYLAMVSAIAYSLWSILLMYNSVSKVGVCGFLTPIFGFILSVLFYDDITKIGYTVIFALILVVVGIIIVNKPDYKKPS